jgi:hypothetical protein
MARTVRRKNFATTLNGYITAGVLKNSHDYDSDLLRWQRWPYYKVKVEGISYEQYVKEKLQAFHLDKHRPMERFERHVTKTPRFVRQVGLKRQTRNHKLAIRKAVTSGDHDVALVKYDNRELIGWWMYY